MSFCHGLTFTKKVQFFYEVLKIEFMHKYSLKFVLKITSQNFDYVRRSKSVAFENKNAYSFIIKLSGFYLKNLI